MTLRDLVAAILVLALPAALLAESARSDISVGDPVERVHAILGQPQGYIRCGTFEVLTYDRGKVALRDGIVTEFELISAEEAEALRIRKEHQREARRQALALRRQELRVEGEALKENTLADPAFFGLTAREKVDFWESFRKRYPDVPVEAEYAGALAQQRDDIEQERMQRRLEDMERRVARAEERAREAERAAERANRRDLRRTYVYYPPASLRYYTPYESICTSTPYRHGTDGPFGKTAFPPSSPSYIWRSQPGAGFSGTVYSSGHSDRSSGVRIHASF